MIAQIPMKDDRKTGYKFLNKTATGVFHPGEDLNSGNRGNADLGLPVRAMAAGEVVYSKYAGNGWGNIVVIHHKELGVWSRYAHFSKVEVVKGDRVTTNTIIGLCGNSGTGSPHLHWEVLKKPLDRWTRYPNGWAIEKVKEYWASPYEFVAKANANTPQALPGWLIPFKEKAREKGVDLNDHARKLSMKELLDALYDMRLIDKPKESITLGELIAALAKISERW